MWSKSLTRKGRGLKRNFWRVVVAVIALLLLWARGEREEWQSSAALCPSGVLPGQSDGTYAPALQKAELDADCKSGSGIRGSLSWDSIMSSAMASIRDTDGN